MEPVLAGLMRKRHCSVVVIECVKIHGQAHLSEIALTGTRTRLLAHVIQRRHQDRQQQCDDGNHDQKFDQGEACLPVHGVTPIQREEDCVSRRDYTVLEAANQEK